MVDMTKNSLISQETPDAPTRQAVLLENPLSEQEPGLTTMVASEEEFLLQEQEVLQEAEAIEAGAEKATAKASDTTAHCIDRRIARTRRALRQALIELMEEQGFDGFTVNDLCARADTNRGTFYNHFNSKEELLLSFEDEVMQDLLRFKPKMQSIGIMGLLRHKLTGAPFSFMEEFFDCLREQGDFLHAVLGPGGDVRFGPRLKDSICIDLIRGILNAEYREDPTPFVNYYISFYASAYLGVIVQWLNTGMKEDSREMSRIAMKLFLIQPGDPIEL